MKIANDKVVSIHYTLTNNDGQTLDSSEGQDPLAYLQGKNNIIPGLEFALEGKETGDKISVTIPPEEAYGEPQEQLVQTVPMSQFEEPDKVAEGIQFQIQSEQGVSIATVIKVEGDNVTVDLNHPLAGVVLNFDVEVMDIREATAQELEQGHALAESGA